jgi:hypothetical protein
VVTAEAPWLDSLLLEELDSPEDSLLPEDELADVPELVVGALDVDDSVLLDAPDAPASDDSVAEALADAAFSAVLAVARLGAVLVAALFVPAAFPAERVEVSAPGVAVLFFVERAGSCPDAS